MKGIIVGAFMIVGGAITAANGAAAYNAIDMGKLSSGAGALAYPSSMNSSGDVVGYSQNNSDGYMHAFRYSNGTLSDIKPPGSASGSYGIAINDSGQIAGYYDGSGTRGFVMSGGTTTTGLSNGGQSTWIEDINNSGQMVGMFGAVNSQHAYLYSGGTYTSLGNAQQVSIAWALNAAGMVVGEAGSHPVIFNGTANPTDLGTLGGNTGRATGVNGSGVVVGYAETNIRDAYNAIATHAFMYANGTKTDLLTLGGLSSYAEDVNSSGWIVGNSQSATSFGDPRAFIYRNGVMSDLNSMIDPSQGWVLEGGVSINDIGMITGYGTHNYVRTSFLLVPVGVPEPSLTGGVGLGVLVAVNRRRRPAR